MTVTEAESVGERTADVCLVLEGTYPYVFGGVSSWVHDLLHAQSDLRFRLACIMPPGHDGRPRFELPPNVVGLDNLSLEGIPLGRPCRDTRTVDGSSEVDAFFRSLEEYLERIQSGGGLDDVRGISRALEKSSLSMGRRVLLDSRFAWEMLLSMYRRSHAGSSFIDYFWSFRAMISGLFSVLLAKLPDARVYHAVSTGYAGLVASRGLFEKRRPVLLTEHGIYTNERRIELAMSDWLYERPTDTLDVATFPRELKDIWVSAFTTYSRVCYQAASEIITLYKANQQFQLEDGADPKKLRIIPNGIDFEAYSAVGSGGSHGKRPTIALIGRVVPIKDVKTYIRACNLLRETVPELRAYVFGPTEEDEEYYQECLTMVRHLALGDVIEFAGKVNLTDYLGRVDVIALTSISEAQPLVILEAGAAGIPTVATDVGACREMLLGREDEHPRLGPGGAVTPLASPAATARELQKLLVDPELRARCGKAMRERVRLYYNKRDLDRAYRELYETLRREPDSSSSSSGSSSRFGECESSHVELDSQRAFA